jgi:hypothetical protein
MVFEDKSPHELPASVLLNRPPLDGIVLAAMGLLDCGVLVSIYSYDEDHMANIE